MTRQEAAKLVAVIVAACPSQSSKLDRHRLEDMVNAFESLLSDIPYERANAALRVLLQTSSWMPSVAEIRATVVELERGPVRSGMDAWGDVLQLVARYGAYRTPGEDFRIPDPAVARCVAAMGWRNICLSENQVADRARFCEFYDDIAESQRKQLRAPELAGDALKLVEGVAKRLTGGGT